MEDFFSCPQYYWARLLFDRGLAILYFVAFLSAFNQFPALLGEKGLLPVPDFIKRINFKDSPTLFFWKYSDSLLRFYCLMGMAFATVITLGLLDQAPVVWHILSWLTLYVLYLSIVNVGQDFYSFGWETMILEAGFFAAFMGPASITPSWIPILILRWMLFRTEMGAGLIKMRGDPCWRNLTCLYYHHETQPLPNPLSRYFHHSPKIVHRFGVVFSHFCQLVCPLGLFLPQPVAGIAGGFLIFHQMILIISGNYSWLNWLTVVLGFLTIAGPESSEALLPRPFWFELLQYAILLLALCLSYRPLLNLFSKRQYMNYCWNCWHLVGAYGAFGSVTKDRYEIVIEGSDDPNQSDWKEYGFKGKPTELDRTPPIVAPYHLRLDWLVWFLPFTVSVHNDEIYVQGHSLWFVRFMKHLLENDKALLSLLRRNPFPNKAPVWVRASFYRYQFTPSASSEIWSRKRLGSFCPPLNLDHLRSYKI